MVANPAVDQVISAGLGESRGFFFNYMCPLGRYSFLNYRFLIRFYLPDIRETRT